MTHKQQADLFNRIARLRPTITLIAEQLAKLNAEHLAVLSILAQQHPTASGVLSGEDEFGRFGRNEPEKP